MAIDWNKIGSTYFTNLEGELDPQEYELERITRRAVDGEAYRKNGKRGKPTSLTGLALVANAAAADTLMTTYKSLQSTIVTIRLRGADRANYLILSVEILRRFEMRSPVHGVDATGVESAFNAAGTCVGVASRWTVQYAST